MKDYKDYMDNISIDPAVKDKILYDTRPTRRRRASANRLLPKGLAAAAAVILIGIVWMIPGLLSNIREPEEAILLECATNNQHNTIHFNIADGFERLPRTLEDGAFVQTVSGDLFRAISPPRLERNIHATAYYLPDGTLSYVDVIFYDPLITNQPIPTRTMPRIWLARDTHHQGITFIYDGATIISHVNGAEVTAHMAPFQGEYFIFSAKFILDGLAYQITTTHTEEAGKLQIYDLVTRIMNYGPPDLSRLDNPRIPDIRRVSYASEEEARQDPTFGALMPITVPEGLNMDFAIVSYDHSHSMSLNWNDQNSDPVRMLSWHMSNLPCNYTIRWINEALEQNGAPFYWHGMIPYMGYELHDHGIQIASFRVHIFAEDDFTLENVQTHTANVESLVGTDCEATLSLIDFDIIAFGVLRGDIITSIYTNKNTMTIEEAFALFP